MASAVHNLESGSPAEMLTGPVVRGDMDTVEAHVRALRTNPDALAVYEALTRAAQSLLRLKQ